MSSAASESFIAIAQSIATDAHRGQVDKLGADCIDHHRRVAERLSDPLEQATAWLVDVLDDTDITRHDLLARGIPGGVVTAVEALTRTDDVSSDDEYYAAIRENPIALAVKRADIADNSEPWRVEQLDFSVRESLALKNEAALAALG
ncbi:guanosine-3',5'-bis(diphosphate) 3'-pyrophosphohydrolase [Cryobacterium sp. TMT1-21]|uniref:Guanosine-3',5'-bis(Diphosphate) 3'-pyrophosphohydrolase n=1 Tax=Cryobacterium shii TaxID=1259235 RepID=A0AAQ2HEP6_9MICO|nr:MULTISPECIES: guanosine-3',5'-bis(diphosphate) 3'-pyrophosphohydrolase [Cryobacterium]TFC42640.1 guanosine-3',5'-bis(diphosphate) 3'-pyrophosphohydrolase [Cryobacterium shii]TFC85657.1 guanosine-3',5'-bis(diphosphate) 3'-pyrophosphohydrolase [Cryobacterium sp. TmT2-59]TFD14604.1 guanosine-3',5'-bis(diphosphate) 3'-pyrophosphohydrolase [Cryobacterium sp. TMT1-21]TFD17789.1 guanosine-3',5'-bis(diphosphate) 3'-pyrophosphohydrolase [Cryobacterium sp. TMT4-10]TFD22767.1 guanosine-3',5'-bis(dipho